MLATWLADRDQAWRVGITTASLDPFRGYATALSNQLPGAVRVLDPFHVVRLALAAVDDVRRRVQQAQTGHRGRAGDPLYGIRRVLRRRVDHLSIKARTRLEAGLVAGDPDGEVSIAWTIAQQVMSLYQLADPDQARTQAAELIAALRSCPIPELARLGRTLHAWRDELVAHFAHPDVSNGPTENLNLKIKNTKRIARGYAISTTTGCDCCSITAASAKLTHRRESGPALPGSLRRARKAEPLLMLCGACR